MWPNNNKICRLPHTKLQRKCLICLTAITYKSTHTESNNDNEINCPDCFYSILHVHVQQLPCVTHGRADTGDDVWIPANSGHVNTALADSISCCSLHLHHHLHRRLYIQLIFIHTCASSNNTSCKAATEAV